MLINHIGMVFLFNPLIYAGRFVFLVYAFLIASGCNYTRDRNKYLLRLAVFAIISEVPFDLAFINIDLSRVSFLSSTNVFFTLLLGVFSIIVYENVKVISNPFSVIILLLFIIPVNPTMIIQSKVNAFALIHNSNLFSNLYDKEYIIYLSWYVLYFIFIGIVVLRAKSKKADTFSQKLLAVFAVLPILFFGDVIQTDGGMLGAAMIFAFYLLNPINKWTRIVVTFVFAWMMYAYSYFFYMFNGLDNNWYVPLGGLYNSGTLLDFGAALAAIPLLMLYNGERGPRVKWAFYAFYPLHLIILVVIRHFIQ
jgi:hypothetical protein